MELILIYHSSFYNFQCRSTIHEQSMDWSYQVQKEDQLNYGLICQDQGKETHFPLSEETSSH